MIQSVTCIFILELERFMVGASSAGRGIQNLFDVAQADHSPTIDLSPAPWIQGL